MYTPLPELMAGPDTHVPSPHLNSWPALIHMLPPLTWTHDRPLYTCYLPSPELMTGSDTHVPLLLPELMAASGPDILASCGSAQVRHKAAQRDPPPFHYLAALLYQAGVTYKLSDVRHVELEALKLRWRPSEQIWDWGVQKSPEAERSGFDCSNRFSSLTYPELYTT
jgi:hypothetical protein